MATSSSANTMRSLSYPTSDDFDDTTAQRLVNECSTLIVEDIPVGTQFGIDLNINNIGHKFMGLKLIPPGLHFIHYSSVSKEESVGPRVGFLRYFGRKELVVRKWNRLAEDIDDEYNDSPQLERYSDNVMKGSMDSHLGAYQFSTYADWVGLTDYITESLFNRLNPKSGRIVSVTQLIPTCGDSVGRNNARTTQTDSEGLPVMEREPNYVINFDQISNRFLYPSDSNSTQISHHSMDSSYTLESLANGCDQMIDILGELQMAFVTFIVGHVFDSFEYWKQLLKILCFAENSIAKYPDFYLNFIRVLHFQLKQTPHQLFADIVDNNNFLVTFLRTFFSNIDSNTKVNENLRKRGLKFRQYLTKNFKWDFSSELEDDEPTIVDQMIV